MLSAFSDALLPSRCASCGVWIATIDPPGPALNAAGLPATGSLPTEKPDRSGAASAAALHKEGMSGLAAMLCDSCRQHVVMIRSPLCTVCGRIFEGRQASDHRCGDCIRRSKHYDRARSAVLYTPGFRKVVHQYKYRGRIRLAGPLGDILLASYLRFWDSGDIDLILPVPLHPKRFRQRGFNQAYRLVAKWRHFESDLTAISGLLVKTRATAPQTGLGKAQRRQNIRNAFAVRRPEAVRSRRILLVDDVYTTGATADECARVLLQHGAARVDVLTLARAV